MRDHPPSKIRLFYRLNCES